MLINPWCIRYSIECGCGWNAHRLCLEIEKDDEYPVSDIITATFVMNASSLRERIRAAWRVLRGEYEYHDIILDDGALTQLEAAVANIIREHKRE